MEMQSTGVNGVARIKGLVRHGSDCQIEFDYGQT